MTAAHQRDQAAPGADATASTRTPSAHEPMDARLRWFIGLHLGSVAMALGVAVSIGGGLALDPFPPDLPRPAAHRAPVEAGAAPTPVAAMRATASDPRDGLDAPRPWSVDPHGAIRWQPD